jgi:hypothetical protein
MHDALTQKNYMRMLGAVSTAYPKNLIRIKFSYIYISIPSLQKWKSESPFYSPLN